MPSNGNKEEEEGDIKVIILCSTDVERVVPGDEAERKFTQNSSRGIALSLHPRMILTLSHLGPCPTTFQARLYRSTILSVLGSVHALMILFLGTHPSHPSWECSGPFSFNFGVHTEPEASEFSKGIVLIGGENVHIRLKGSSPMDDVRCYKHPPILKNKI
ncbi:hypothetical protein DVH24_038856 [Malus domestica]|uniref:Uncharacterized protein n=1 Tax=Malus domestica TaxID=3750 RepID=A0A498KG59_MALDO|nr:hypothetical protein DVH24_038856 [Malus domestica]